MILRRLLLVLGLTASAAMAQTDYTTTPNLGLRKPNMGSTNAGLYINQDFDTLDAAIGVFKGGFVADPFATTHAIDLTKGNTHQITLSADVTVVTVNQPLIKQGQLLYLIVCQDVAGGHAYPFSVLFQSPLPSITSTALKCTDTSWQWNGTIWISAGGGGGGGGGATPAQPDNALQKTLGTSLISSSIIDNGTTVSTSEAVLFTNTLNVNGTATFVGTLSVGGTGLAGSASGTATLPANTGTVAELNFGQTWSAPQTYNAAALLLNPGPLILATSAATTRTATFPDNTGIVAELNLGETWTAAQTYNAATLLLNPGPLTLATLASVARTATFPDNTGTVAETNLAQSWSAAQTFTNGTELRFLSTNATNYAGFKGGASVVNLVWILPTTDSTGTQCLSSNGSIQLAWSACSAGTGTPGGASTQLQFNTAGTFAASPNLTWVSPKLTIGVATSTTGQLGVTGATSGTVTITAQATAGSPTLTLPNTTGTFATNATVPLTIDAAAGTIACATCTTNAAALTANQLLIGSGLNAHAALGTLGTTITVLHGNAGGAPTFAAVNLATETTGIAAIANGGTGQSIAANAFNALSPITTAGDLILGTGVNTAGRLAIGTNGLCLVSNGTTATWNSCASGAVGGTAISGQGTFWSASSSIAGSANWTYAAASGHSVTQGANAADAFFMKRATDTTPTGNFLHFRDAANAADLAKIDVNGNLSVAGTLGTTSSSIAGGIYLGQGPAPTLVANTITLSAPVAVSAAGEVMILPGTGATGFLRFTNVSNVVTGAYTAASGIGACANSVVTATNDNAPPTCSPTTGAMFGAQAANAVLAGPNGSAGNPTFRTLVSGDIPTINLNLGGAGGITGTLPIANGGTNATTANGGFNNLSPMTTAGDVIYGGASGAGTRLAAGTAIQVFHSGSTPSWSAVALTADVSGILPLANGGTNASTGLTNTNGVVYSDGTKLVSTATGGAGTLCLTSVSGAVPSFGSCSGSAGAAWGALTAPGNDLALSMGTFNTTFTHGIMVGTRNIMEWTDGASTSTGSFLNVHTNASSTMKPFTFTAKGTANGIQMDNTGSVTVLGSGGITATSTSLSISTSAPLGGGGAFNTNLTLTCTICVTSGSSLTSNAVVIGSGGGQGAATISADTTTTHVLFATATAPAFRAIVTGDLPSTVVTGTAAAAAKQTCVSGGASSTCSYIDFPDYHYFPAADCVNAVAASGWSTSATPVATCRAGTNNKEGFLGPWGASDTAQMSIGLPADWDTATNPSVRVRLATTDATAGHTIIMQVATACGKGDGTTTDDVAFNAAQSLGTVTLVATANQQWDATLSNITMTGCIAGGTLRLQLSRTTDTATNVEVYGLGITVPRLLTVQAN